MERIKSKAIANGTHMKAPNGKKYCDHALTEIEKGKLLNVISQSGFKAMENSSLPSSAVFKETKIISIPQTNASKVVDKNRDRVQIIRCHYLDARALDQKERQAIREGGLILTLSKDNAAGNAPTHLTSTSKDSEVSDNKQKTNAFLNEALANPKLIVID